MKKGVVMGKLGYVMCAALALAGCAAPSGSAGLSAATVAQYRGIANGLLSIAGTEAQIAGASPELVARIAADAELARVAIAGLTPGLAAAAATPSVHTVQLAADEVLSLASGLPLSPSVQQIVLALRVLLPVAEAALTPGESPAAAATPDMTPSQALAVLQSAPRG